MKARNDSGRSFQALFSEARQGLMGAGRSSVALKCRYYVRGPGHNSQPRLRVMLASAERVADSGMGGC